jgi:hypothetical protein
MGSTNERIEVGLDPQGERVTIVVGNENNSILAVQSVVVLKADFIIKKKHPWSLGERKSMFRRRSNSNLSNSSPAPPRYRNLRSDLLRPESPKPERPSSRRGERDQPPISRGRDLSRSDRSVSSRSSRHSHQGNSRRRPSMNGSVSSKNSRQALENNSSSQRTDLAPMQETNTLKKNVSGKRRLISYRPQFRNHRVDPVLMVADV